MNVFPGMSDAEFEAEIQKEAERLNHEFNRFVRSGKSYEEFLLEKDIAELEKTLQARKKQEQAEQQQVKKTPAGEPSKQKNTSDSRSQTTILRTIDDLLMDLERKKDQLITHEQERPTVEATDHQAKHPPTTPVKERDKEKDNKSSTIDDILKKAQKTEKDPLDFLEDL